MNCRLCGRPAALDFEGYCPAEHELERSVERRLAKEDNMMRVEPESILSEMKNGFGIRGVPVKPETITAWCDGYRSALIQFSVWKDGEKKTAMGRSTNQILEAVREAEHAAHDSARATGRLP